MIFLHHLEIFYLHQRSKIECATWLPETREPEKKKPVKAGTGRGRFEIFRFQVSRTRPERGLERHGFSREFFSRPEDPKMPLSQIKHFLCTI